MSDSHDTSLKNNDPNSTNAFIENELQNWSRHYDTILWQVTAVFMAALALVLLEANKTQSVVICIFGLFITLIAVYIAAGLRQLRYGMHEKMSKSSGEMFCLKSSIRGHRCRLWLCYMIVFFIFQSLFTYILVNKADTIKEQLLYTAILALCALVLSYFYRIAKDVTDRDVTEPSPAPKED